MKMQIRHGAQGQPTGQLSPQVAGRPTQGGHDLILAGLVTQSVDIDIGVLQFAIDGDVSDSQPHETRICHLAQDELAENHAYPISSPLLTNLTHSDRLVW